ncbi:hypothetical protein [Veillonella sp.]
MELRSLTRIPLPKDQYVYLLGMAISVFIYNNGFIIENIINTDKSYSWYDLIDKESDRLNSLIAQTITKNAGSEIADLFSEILYMRNRIIHSFRCTLPNEEQILATKDRVTNQQFYIDEQFLINFVELNNKLSYLLHEYRGY